MMPVARVGKMVTGIVSPSRRRRSSWPARTAPGRQPRDAVSAVVIIAPDGPTSHHFAPKLSLPWPAVWPGPESPTK